MELEEIEKEGVDQSPQAEEIDTSEGQDLDHLQLEEEDPVAHLRDDSADLVDQDPDHLVVGGEEEKEVQAMKWRKLKLALLKVRPVHRGVLKSRKKSMTLR